MWPQLPRSVFLLREERDNLLKTGRGGTTLVYAIKVVFMFDCWASKSLTGEQTLI